MAMYQMEPLFELPTGVVQLPTNMYTMESIMPELSVAGSSGSSAGGGSRLDQLAARQLRIIKEAQELTDQVDALLKSANISATGKHGQSMPSNDMANQPPAKTDMTIVANTAAPPRTTLMVAAHLKTAGVMFRSRQFWHSTNGPMPSGFREANPPHNDACDLRVNLVWKPDAGTAGRISACAHAPLQGDITIARHLCRAFKSPLYPDEDAMQAAQVDEWVDQAASFATAATKDIKTVLKNLNTALGKSSNLVGNTVTLADLAIWGSLRTYVTASLPSNVKKWAKDMDESSEAEAVAAMLACLQ